MSKGNDSRTRVTEDRTGRSARDASERAGRSSRTSVRMTAERARAIQSHADRTGTNADFKARATAAAARNDDEDDE